MPHSNNFTDHAARATHTFIYANKCGIQLFTVIICRKFPLSTSLAFRFLPRNYLDTTEINMTSLCGTKYSTTEALWSSAIFLQSLSRNFIITVKRGMKLIHTDTTRWHVSRGNLYNIHLFMIISFLALVL